MPKAPETQAIEATSATRTLDRIALTIFVDDVAKELDLVVWQKNLLAALLAKPESDIWLIRPNSR